MTLPNVFFITGTSSGFGRVLVEQLSAQGQNVIATARNLDKIKDFDDLPNVTILQLDVSDSEEEIGHVVDQALGIHGYVTHIINNAGYGLSGCVEEPSIDQAKRQFDVNYWGAVSVTRKFLPHLRTRTEGDKCIAAVSSAFAFQTQLATSYYCATKAAMEMTFEALKMETQHLGIKVLLIEPGAFRTNILHQDTNIHMPKHSIADYSPITDNVNKMYKELDGQQVGDTGLGCKRMIELMNMTGEAKEISKGEMPVRVALGPDAVDMITKKGNELVENCNKWADFSKSTDRKA